MNEGSNCAEPAVQSRSPRRFRPKRRPNFHGRSHFQNRQQGSGTQVDDSNNISQTQSFLVNSWPSDHAGNQSSSRDESRFSQSEQSIRTRGNRHYRGRPRLPRVIYNHRPEPHVDENEANTGNESQPLRESIENLDEKFGQSRRSRGRGNSSRTLLGESREAIRNELNFKVDVSDPANAVDHRLEARENLSESRRSEQSGTTSMECMICCDDIKRFHPIWSCTNCYNVFHLKCSIEWCKKSINSRNEAIMNAQYPSLNMSSSDRDPSSISRLQVGSSNNLVEARVNSIEWPCPACREILHNKPSKYKCFCGKVVKPEMSRGLQPHSCGQLCGRKRPNVDCPHSCNTICHPGRCEPCTLASKRTCFCGKVTQELKCRLGTVSCNQVCGKLLSCGQHGCTKLCHNGSCDKCDKIVTINCNCGDTSIEKSCDELSKQTAKGKSACTFSCGKICGKSLDCGLHKCEEKCHSSSCKSCPLLNENLRTCPCGASAINKPDLTKRKSCLDPIPTCGNKCNRSLICGPERNHHKCQKKCHISSCPPCKLKTTITCQCRQSNKTVDCMQLFERVVDGEQVYFKPKEENSFKCEIKCNKLKNCGRHRCTIKCCNLNEAAESGAHKCDQICNRKLACGKHPCPEPCHPGQCGDCTNIGWSELTCHCGGSVLYPPIPCGSRAPTCHRPCRRTHACGHPVKHECHDDSEKCAPCTVFVKKSCFCGSDSKESVYCYLAGYSCGRTCRKQLHCKQHLCKRICHENDCETPNDKGVLVCTQPCPILRSWCKHPCGLICHGSSPCPPSECKKKVEITCECGNKKETIECHKLTKDMDNRNKIAVMTMNRTDQDSTIMIDLSRKVPLKSEERNSESRGNPDTKRLDCDDTCAILKRNKALAEALDIAQPDLKPSSIFGEDPLRLLKEATAQDYKFVSSTYNSLVRLIKSAKESDKKFIFLQFPPAEKLRREVIHELAYHFNCTSESRDEEPFRHVVVRAYKSKSSVPEFNIEQLLPVSSEEQTK